MNFASDNWSGATPEVMAAIARHNGGFAPAYGGDMATAEMGQRFNAVFDTEVEVWCVGSGTAANALSMAAAARPGGLILCSETAHLYHDELGAAEFFSGGMKLVTVPSQHGLMSAEALAETLARFPAGNRTGRPTVLSLTEASELGTVYGPDALHALAGIAHAAGMVVHMDGARFANAVATLGTTPAALSWQAGIDIMSFGATKNGCWAADAVVVFAPQRFGDLATLRQRSGHTASKSRFMAAQFEGYLEDGNWLRTAAHANAMAQRLVAGIAASGSARLAWEPQANEVFAVLTQAAVARLRAAGAAFHEWPADDVALAADEVLVRLVTSWATDREEVEAFVGLL
ncbi:MAG TPA: beta-eliminating lyase-related protein [Devosiaceae bacterium]|nr:beta-eliminating lyase-related protein [Devosiaceae bacterium]